MTVDIWKCPRPLFGKCYCIDNNVEGEGKKGRERRREKERQRVGGRERKTESGRNKGREDGGCV